MTGGRAFICFAISAALICFGGCKNAGGSDEAVLVTETAGTVTETALEIKLAPVFDEYEKRRPVTFAEKETVSKKNAEHNVKEEERAVILAENQIDYSGENFYLVMGFTGCEPQKHYPNSVSYSPEAISSYIIHSNVTVTNLSDDSLLFFPDSFIIYGRHNNHGGAMLTISDPESGLADTEYYYAVKAGETVSFDVDFYGDGVCTEYAYEIYYRAADSKGYEYVSAEDKSAAAAESFRMNKRTAVKNAIIAGNAIASEKRGTPQVLVPREGEYSVLTQKNSCCFTAEPINGEDYVRVALRLQCLTGEPEFFNPHRFYLYDTDGNKHYARCWSIDTCLTKDPEVSEKRIKGVSETLYKMPFWKLAVRPDGTAEYTMYFSVSSDELNKIFKFVYDGSDEDNKEFFEHTINLTGGIYDRDQ